MNLWRRLVLTSWKNKIAPNYIQLAIRKMFKYSQMMKDNGLIVKEWMEKNEIDKSIPLENLLTKPKIKPKIKGQMSIYDFIKEN